MSKHTPGPWEVIKTGYTGRASAKYVIVPNGSTRAVAHIKHSTISPMEANARLMAAAPDLLEALKHIEKTIMRQLDLIAGNASVDVYLKNPVVHSMMMHARRARAAIAKAEGEMT